MSAKMAGIVEYFSKESQHNCGYCKGVDSSVCKGMWAHQLSSENYQDLIDRGWRRSGKYCYKPTMNTTCCPQYTIRCDAMQFKLSKSHKKIIKRLCKFLNTGIIPKENEKIGEGDNEEHITDCKDRDMNDYGRSRKKGENISIEHTSESRLPDLPPSHIESDVVQERIQETMDQDGSLNSVEAVDRMKEGGQGQKKKLLRRQKWMEKRLAQNQPIDKPAIKNEEKTLDEWLKLPQGKHKLKVSLVQSQPASKSFQATEDASHEVYLNYQMAVHGDPPGKCTKANWQDFLVKSPILKSEGEVLLGSFHQQYWLDDKLIAVGVLDILPKSVSAVYFYYDPKYSFLSLGTFSSLVEIKLVRDLNRKYPDLRHYYMGFYIHSCPKMRYKGRLPNSDLLCPETYTWIPIESCLPLLDANKYNRLNPDKTKDDDNCMRNPGLCTIFTNRGQVLTFNQFRAKHSLTSEEEEEVREYCQLVGKKVAKKVYLYRT